MAIATENTTTVPRSTEGLILSAANPPMTPPNNAPTAITIAADHITLFENKKRTAQLICPCLIGRKHLMRRSYPAAVGDTTPRSRQIFVVKKRKVKAKRSKRSFRRRSVPTCLDVII